MIIDKKIRIAVADPYPIITSALIEKIDKFDEFFTVFYAGTGEELVRKINAEVSQLDVLLTDLNFSHGGNDDGFRLIKKIHNSGKVKKIFIFSDMKDTLTLSQLLEQPLAGIISKRDDLNIELQRIIKQCASVHDKKKCYFSPAIRHILGNLEQRAFSPILTPREFEVVKLYAEGMRLKEIASRLKRSVGTIAVHKYNAMKKMNFDNNAQLIDFARQAGIYRL
ncbi:MAG: response regulator transcription factor [Enterobacterales bacterium endosymbiont of Blomia tropicalis]|uniref:response regulator transcription factor n=1 Tax=Mixta mediterraneensis TaxID=2758443 RepID=UPI0025A92BC5|nr:response regulator transcription factor [Mixta mediterraneensis]MDL4914963.1 response regulator transcription factor [Mixta mediterraneensis]